MSRNTLMLRASRFGLTMTLGAAVALTTACGGPPEARPQKMSASSDKKDSGDAAKKKPTALYGAEALALANQIEEDLLAQGVQPEVALAIKQGALEGSKAPSFEGADQLNLNLGSLLPGLLKGAFGVAKAVLGGTPLGIIGGIVESVVKGISKKPSDSLANIPAMAFDVLMKMGLGQNANPGKPDVLAALLAAASGLGVVPKLGGSGTVSTGQMPALANNMMENLVKALASQTNIPQDQMMGLLQALQGTVQERLLANSKDAPSQQLVEILGAALDGQYKALLSNPNPLAGILGAIGAGQNNGGAILLPALIGGLSPEQMVAELIKKSSSALVEKLGVKDEALKEKLQDWMVEMATNRAGTISKMKVEALQVALKGMTQGIVNSKIADKTELAQALLEVARQLDPSVVNSALAPPVTAAK